MGASESGNKQILVDLSFKEKVALARNILAGPKICNKRVALAY